MSDMVTQGHLPFLSSKLWFCDLLDTRSFKTQRQVNTFYMFMLFLSPDVCFVLRGHFVNDSSYLAQRGLTCLMPWKNSSNCGIVGFKAIIILVQRYEYFFKKKYENNCKKRINHKISHYLTTNIIIITCHTQRWVVT